MSTPLADLPLVPFERAVVAQSDRGRRVKQRDYLPEGRIPVIDQGQSPVGGYTNDDDLAFTGELPVVIFGDHTRAVKLVEQRFAVGADGVKIFRPAEGVRPKYLYYWMKSAPLPDRGYGRHYQYLRQLLLPLPPPQQQDEIVAELEKRFSRLDEAIANLKRVKANLARQKLAIFVSATSGKLLPPSSAAIDDSKIAERRAELPSGWRWIEIGELADVVRGGSPRPAGDPRYFGGPIPWITVGPLTADNDDYLRSVPTGLTEAGRERSRYIEPHTLLLTNSGATLGVPKISLIGGCINDGVAALLNVDYPLKKYLLVYLHSKTAEMRRVNQGAAQPNLNTTIIKRYRVPIPPTDEQNRIVAEVDRRISIVREVEAEVDASLTRAQALSQAVLAAAFAQPDKSLLAEFS